MRVQRYLDSLVQVIFSLAHLSFCAEFDRFNQFFLFAFDLESDFCVGFELELAWYSARHSAIIGHFARKGVMVEILINEQIDRCSIRNIIHLLVLSYFIILVLNILFLMDIFGFVDILQLGYNWMCNFELIFIYFAIRNQMVYYTNIKYLIFFQGPWYPVLVNFTSSHRQLIGYWI